MFLFGKLGVCLHTRSCACEEERKEERKKLRKGDSVGGKGRGELRIHFLKICEAPSAEQ